MTTDQADTAAIAKATPLAPLFNHLQFDKDCEHYKHLRAEQKEITDAADALKAKIMSVVHQFGKVPDNAPKSRRVAAEKFLATMTVGSSVEVNDSVAFELELLLSKARRSSLFPQIFSRRSEYSLEKTAPDIIAHAKWPAKHAEEIRSLYARCFSVKPSTPSLSVETKVSFEERETKSREAAEKKAAKAAKKAGR